MPVGWVLDRDGKAVTDPDIALAGLQSGDCALAPLGGIGEELAGYKGYGYAVVVEVLSAALQAGNYLKMLSGFDENKNKIPYKLGQFFIAIDINAFTEPEKFKKTAGDILRKLRESKKAKGAERIYTAGEKEYLAYLERKEHGIPINDEVRKALTEVRDKYSIDFKFVWD